MACTKVRLRFAKRGDLRLVSHHDLMRCLERMARRAAIPVATTQGFNPRPRLVFALALGLGLEGRREVLDLELAEPMEPEDLRARLAAESPPGLDWLEAEALTDRRLGARVASATFELPLPADRLEAARRALDALLASPNWPITRRKSDRTGTFDLRPFLIAAEVDPPGALRFRLRMAQDGGSARPEEIVEALGLRDLLDLGAVLARTDLELAPAPTSGPDRPAPARAEPDDGDPIPARAGPPVDDDDGPSTDHCPP